jgi:hypothetical protein
MAYGFRCIHCGWQETDHKGTTTSPEEITKSSDGFKFSLQTCPGYTPSPEDAKFEKDNPIDNGHLGLLV